MSDLPVVWYERRAGLWLGAVQRESPKKLTLVDEQGDTTRIERDRVLATLDARVPSGGVKAALRALREGWASLAPPEPEELWASLAEGPHLLKDVAARRFPDPGDEQLYALTRALLDEEGKLREGFFVREGALHKRSAELRERIRLRVEQTQRESRAKEELQGWWAKPQTRPSAALEESLRGLCDYALAGERTPEHQRWARMVKPLGIASPDELLEALVARGRLPVEVNEQPARLGLARGWSAAEEAEAERVAASPTDPRGEDLREVLTLAIDAPGADEIDDAISFFEREGERFVAIHIARPADLIDPAGALEACAQRRATSIYFASETIPMLPGAVTARCGLQAGVEREALSWIAPLSRQPSGDPLGEGRFARTRIRVDYQVDFQEAETHPQAATLLAELLPCAEALYARRRAEGAFLARSPNIKVVFDERGDPSPQHLSVEGPAQLLVSELMVLYNERLALALAAAEGAAFYRVQPTALEPRAIGLEPFDVLQARRSLPPTRVQLDPGPQRTMGLEGYVQASSPLRRCGDLIAQRQLLSLLDGGPWAYEEERLRELIASVPKRERQARQAEEARFRFHLARWLAGRRRFRARLARRGQRASVFLEEWLREVPARLPSGDSRAPGARVEVEVLSAEPRGRILLKVL